MPGPTVVDSAVLFCPFGTAPSSLMVTSNETVLIDGLPIATIVDMAPFVNIPPFGTCDILTAMALGVPTPCIPAPVDPWLPGSLCQFINGLPVLTQPAELICALGGVISVLEPSQFVEISG